MLYTVCSCGPFDDQSSKCFNHISNGIDNFDMSNQIITTALVNVTDIVNGSYCKERVMEFLCNYFFPQCDSDSNIVPICEQSCNEHLITGICAKHLFNALVVLNATVSVNGLLQKDCSPPYDATVSNSCTTLTRECILHCILYQSD